MSAAHLARTRPQSANTTPRFSISQCTSSDRPTSYVSGFRGFCTCSRFSAWSKMPGMRRAGSHFEMLALHLGFHAANAWPRFTRAPRWGGRGQ